MIDELRIIFGVISYIRFLSSCAYLLTLFGFFSFNTVCIDLFYKGGCRICVNLM